MWRYVSAFILTAISVLFVSMVLEAGMKLQEAAFTAVVTVFGIMTLGNEVVVRFIFTDAEQRASLKAILQQDRRFAINLYVGGAILGIVSTIISLVFWRFIDEGPFFAILIISLPFVGFTSGALWIMAKSRRYRSHQQTEDNESSIPKY